MTKTEVCNDALAHLGQHRIVDIDELSQPAEECRRGWNNVRDTLLRDFPWNFAIKRANLSLLSEVPAFDWAKAYALPADYLQMLEFNGIEAGTARSDYEIEAGKLLSDSATSQLRYIARIEDCALWDPSFCATMSLRLAAKIAPSLSSAPAMADGLLARASSALKSAQGADSVEGRPRVIFESQDSGYMRARSTGSYSPQAAPNWD